MPDQQRMEVDWAARLVVVTFTLRGDDAERALNAAGNDLPAYAKAAVLAAVPIPRRYPATWK